MRKGHIRAALAVIGVVGLITLSAVIAGSAQGKSRPVVGAKLKAYVPPAKHSCDIRVPAQFATIQAAVDASVSWDAPSASRRARLPRCGASRRATRA